MNLDDVFVHREDWQRDAFERIKQKLTAAKDNRFVQYDAAQEEHLVILYGDSQVGKTTLILTMIGIREGRDFQEVYDTLRAEISPGNSSTSTAIIYSRSEDDRYGLAVGSIGSGPPQNFQSCDAEGMVRRLKEVRAAVESNRATADSILYIAIPGRYFTEQAARERIVILDMPGVNSRNHKEDEHVRSLMTRYVPIASACVIACRCNVIQSLETLALPGEVDWKQMGHRFVLAVTHAYNDGNIKKYFAQSREGRESGFYDHVMKVYTESVRGILGKDNHTMIYPIDVGDSMNALSQVLSDEQDRRELLAARDRVLSDLRGWISSHRDNRLNAALDNLRDLVEHAGEDAIREIERKDARLHAEIESARQKIMREERRIQILIGNGVSEEDGEDVSQRDALREELQALREARDGFQANDGVTGLYQALQDRLRAEKLEQGGDGAYWKDKDKKAHDALRGIAVDKSEECVKRLKPWADVSAAVRYVDINQCCMEFWDQIGPVPQGFLFIKSDRVYIDKLKDVCAGVEKEINRRLNKAVQPRIKELEKKLGAKEQEIEAVEYQAKECQARIERLCREIEGLERRIKEECAAERTRLERIKKKDQETLAIYQKYTREIYEGQRRRLMSQINSRQLPSEDKLMLILFLGVLDRDYQKVTGGI